MKLDEIDRKILDILQTDANITNAQLASQLGISPPGMLERVKRLENSGVIKRYVAIVDPEKLNKGTLAFIQVSLTVHQLASIEGFRESINNLEEVLECYHVAGEEDFMLKIAVKDIQEYERFVLYKLTPIKGISKINTKFVLSTFKYNTRIHINTDTNSTD